MSQELQVVKRDGRIVPFDRARIEHAIERVFDEVYATEPYARPSLKRTWLMTDHVLEQIIDVQTGTGLDLTVEQIQDHVERELMEEGHYDAAKCYILYRAKHAELRDERPIPDDVRAAFEASKRYFPQPSQELVYYLNYARWSDAKGRRETWPETVDRSVDFLYEIAGDRLPREVYDEIRLGILEMRAMPSMRLLAMAGAPARRSGICTYNCSAQGVSSLDAFVEALIISMSGCGVGFSVERRFVDQLPSIRPQLESRPRITYTVEDSTEGWAHTLRAALWTWVEGYDCSFDFSEIRPAGAILKTKGGRASGPDPLRTMLSRIRSRILSRQGGRLSSLDAHDLMCAVGDAAIMGGMRRSAMLSLFDHDDEAMRLAKAPGFEREHSQRWNANNSSVWSESMTQAQFATQFMDMVHSGNGEPGIFNRRVSNLLLPERRQKCEWLTNPCNEILLRDMQFCNLSISVARADDTEESLAEKVRLASIIGSIQSMITNFPGLRPQWRKNCEEERLLGVDITGHYDCPVVRDPSVLARLRAVAVETNRLVAAELGINQSAAVTCVKPSGNSAQLLDVSSGIHPRYARYYIRRYRVAATSALYHVLKDAGVPLSPENGQGVDDAVTWVASFPIKAPEGAITRDDISALGHCEYWLTVRKNYTEHKPSCTVYYGPDEIIDLMKWVWDHRDEVDGISFLPRYDINLDQMPYEEISPVEYERLVAAFPVIDFAKMMYYEAEDHTAAATEVACVGGLCELI